MQADPLRLTLCPGCGYSLTGLGDEGVCPECGRPFDQRTVVLFGWGRGTHATALTATPGVAAALLAFQSFGMLHSCINPASPPGLRAGMFALWLGLIGWAVWQRRSRPELPGRVQVRLSDAGCQQIDNPDKDAPAVTPWGRISEWEVSELKPGRYRVRMWCPVKWWKPRMGTDEPVDAEVECTPEQAAAVRERVRVWLSAGRDAGGEAPPGAVQPWGHPRRPHKRDHLSGFHPRHDETCAAQYPSATAAPIAVNSKAVA